MKVDEVQTLMCCPTPEVHHGPLDSSQWKGSRSQGPVSWMNSIFCKIPEVVFGKQGVGFKFSIHGREAFVATLHSSVLAPSSDARSP